MGILGCWFFVLFELKIFINLNETRPCYSPVLVFFQLFQNCALMQQQMMSGVKQFFHNSSSSHSSPFSSLHPLRKMQPGDRQLRKEQTFTHNNNSSNV